MSAPHCYRRRVLVISPVMGIMALVVLSAGVVKLHRPDAFASAMRLLGVPVGRTGGRVLARAVGLAEVAVGAASVLWWRPAHAALALLCVAFAVVSLRALRAGAASCGCFGSASAPPNVAHVAMNAVGALAAGAVWLAAPAALPVATWVVLAIGAATVVTGMTVGAEVARGVRQVAGHGATFRQHASASRMARS